MRVRMILVSEKCSFFLHVHIGTRINLGGGALVIDLPEVGRAPPPPSECLSWSDNWVIHAILLHSHSHATHNNSYLTIATVNNSHINSAQVHYMSDYYTYQCITPYDHAFGRMNFRQQNTTNNHISQVQITTGI